MREGGREKRKSGGSVKEGKVENGNKSFIVVTVSTSLVTTIPTREPCTQMMTRSTHLGMTRCLFRNHA